MKPVISQKTNAIARRLADMNVPDLAAVEKLCDGHEVSLTELLDVLGSNIENVTEEQRLLLQSLILSCLNDLSDSLPSPVINPVSRKKSRWKTWGKAAFVILAGIVFFGFEGFDGVVSVLQLTGIPSVPILLIGLAFAALWSVVFLLVELRELSSQLGVKFKSVMQLADSYVTQMAMIKALRKKINRDYRYLDEDSLSESLAILNMLYARLGLLEEAQTAMHKALNRPLLKAGKFAFALLSGVVVFSSGFMTGQTVALAFAAVIIGGASSTAWPILLVSILAGLAAFAFYWYINRPAIENLIGRGVGLDKEKVDEFLAPQTLEKESEKLMLLTDNIRSRSDLLQENRLLREENTRLQIELEGYKTSGVRSPRLSFFAQKASDQDESFTEEFGELPSVEAAF